MRDGYQNLYTPESPLVSSVAAVELSRIRQRLAFATEYNRGLGDFTVFFTPASWFVLWLGVRSFFVVPAYSVIGAFRAAVMRVAVQLTHLVTVFVLFTVLAAAVGLVRFNTKPAFATFPDSLRTTFSIISGADAPEFILTTTNGIIYYIFVWTVSNFIWLNLFIALIAEGYSAVLSESNDKDYTEAVWTTLYLWLRYQFCCCFGKQPQLVDAYDDNNHTKKQQRKGNHVSQADSSFYTTEEEEVSAAPPSTTNTVVLDGQLPPTPETHDEWWSKFA
eukprot:TRINITY_DN39320_c0_g1_i2.p1 TRINITY_DN39320_c0_g1~~TRINITY_DN39320_c0_g1_i2.p1  ORF type:complete len:276 (-),score=31.07 TRINITY_DN39320_c0_g1_i2:92-919(-)